MYIGFEERFREDAVVSELSLAYMRAKLKRFKASFKGGTVAKARLFTLFLPLASLFLPWGSLSASLPFAAWNWEAGLLSFINLAMGDMESLPYLQEMASSPEWGGLFRIGVLLLLSFAAAALCGVIGLVASAFSFASLKKMSAVAGVALSLGAVAAVAAFAAGFLLRQASADVGNAFYGGALGYGAPLSFVLYAFAAVLNFIIVKNGVPAKYPEGEFERAEIYRKVKKGEIQIEDLTYPVVETEKTRKLEELIQQDIKAGGIVA